MRRLLVAVFLVLTVWAADAQWQQSKIVYSLSGGVSNRVVLFAGTPTTNFIFASSLTLTDLTNNYAWASNSWVWIGGSGYSISNWAAYASNSVVALSNLWHSNTNLFTLTNDFHQATNQLQLELKVGI